MKKKLSVLLMSVIMLSLVACGGTREEPELSPKRLIVEDVKNAVSTRVELTVLLRYETEGRPTITHYVHEIGYYKFEVKGKVTIRDPYGDSYTGKYDAVVEYDLEEEESNIVSFHLGTPYLD